MYYFFLKDISMYIIIFRDSVDQFELVFNYIEFGEVFGFGRDLIELIKLFFRNGIEFKNIIISRLLVLVRNFTMFDFGLDYQFYQNLIAIKEYIVFLEKEFDLVMIMEYFEELMVFLKRLFCWEFEDFFYIKFNARLDKERVVDMSDNLKENIRRWNKVDVLLYEYFNRTFWY